MEMNGNINRVFVSSDGLLGHFPWLLRCRYDIPGVSSKCCTVTSVNRVGDRTAMPEDSAWTHGCSDRRCGDRYLALPKIAARLIAAEGVEFPKTKSPMATTQGGSLKKQGPNIEKKKCVEKLERRSH
ncbi:Homeobox protein Nkx-2.5 [Xyrichtys novacula]|uniref:Homeobox protein Nkx-2.5 n=1 Tax=Xyrichtys novacula TaxID=13765 RepID=A0AAV1G143_XYRNO|nr:Homeobox protein Nkx-2.5 [Xyrichtys novacula]